MNLIWFLTIATLLSITLGEFGQLPFGSPTSISLTDLLLSVTITLLIIWQLALKKFINLPPLFGWLVVFWIWAFLTLIISQDLRGGWYLLRLVLYGFSFWLGWLLIKKGPVKFNQLVSLIALVGVILSLTGLAQLVIFPDLTILTDFGYDPHQSRLVGAVLDPNLLGVLLNISLALGFYRWWQDRRLGWLLATLITLAALILTFSRSAYLMLAVEVFLVGLLRLPKLLLTMVVVMAALIVLFPRVSERIMGAVTLDKTSQERIESWQNGLVVFRQHPLTGIGFNNLRQAYQSNNLLKVFQSDGGHSGSGNDSSLIVVLATTGVLGLGLYLAFWGKLLRILVSHGLADKKLNWALVISGVIIGLFLSSQFINSLFYPPVMLTIYLVAGAMLADML